ncbi:hypothetical protein D3C81_1333390 [compost metagenome]
MLLTVCDHERGRLVSSLDLKLRTIGASLKPLVIKKYPPVTWCGSIFVLFPGSTVVPIQDNVRCLIAFECGTGAESRHLVVVSRKLIRTELGAVLVLNNNQELIHRVDHQQIQPSLARQYILSNRNHRMEAGPRNPAWRPSSEELFIAQDILIRIPVSSSKEVLQNSVTLTVPFSRIKQPFQYFRMLVFVWLNDVEDVIRSL